VRGGEPYNNQTIRTIELLGYESRQAVLFAPMWWDRQQQRKENHASDFVFNR
jgi:hypothetical protein